MKAFFYKLTTVLVIVSLLLSAVPGEMVRAMPVKAEHSEISKPDKLLNSQDVQPGNPSPESNSRVFAPENVVVAEHPQAKVIKVSASVSDYEKGLLISPQGDWQVEYQYYADLPNRLILQSTRVEQIAGWLGSAGVSYKLSSRWDGRMSRSEPTDSFEFLMHAQYTDAGVWGLDEATLAIYWRETALSSWQRLPTLVNLETQQLTTKFDQTGEFAVFGKLKVRNLQTPDNLKLVLDADDDVGHANWPNYGYISELPYNVKLATQVRDRLAADGCTVDVLLTRETASPRYVSRSTRAQMARDFGADMFVTFAFNALNGSPWGREGNGGIEAWARSGHPDDDALVNEFYNRIKEYTGRPHVKGTLHPSKYSDFNNLPAEMTYAHIEALFLDHNYDWPVIREQFDAISNAAYAAIRTQLETQGMTCLNSNGEVNPLPAPPSPEMLKRLRDLGYQNYQRYGADPVSFSTGNHIIRRDLFSVTGQGGTNLDFSLIYNSQDDRVGYFGIGWSSLIAYVQRYRDESVSVTLQDGRTYYFPFKSGGYEIPDELKITFERTSDGWRWVNLDGSSMFFVEAKRGLGVVTEIQDRHGLKQVFEYDFSDAGAVRPALQAITDTAGQVTRFESDGDGYITKIILPEGRTYQFEYIRDTLTKITNAMGGSYTYAYDELGRIVKEWDAEGILFLQVQYDDRDRVIGQIDASGAELKLSYEPGVTTYTDNLGHVTKYFYDSQNRVTGTQDALGQTTSFAYDDRNNPILFIDERGNRFEYTYDENNNRTRETGPDGLDVSDGYNQFGDLTSITDKGGKNGQTRTTSFSVNDKGEVERIDYPDDTKLQMTYDSSGNLKTVTNQNNFTAYYDYNERGLLIQVKDNLGFITQYTYDAAGRMIRMTDAKSNVVEFQYDANSNLTKIVDPKKNATIFSYDKNDNLVKMVDRLGGIWGFTYNDDLKLETETDPGGHVTSYEYDEMYNLVSVKDGRGNFTRYIYNARYEVEQIIAANEGETRFTYDPAGNVVEIIDPLEQQTKFEYNGLGLLVAQIDALNGRTEFVYDAVGRLMQQTNPRGAKTFFTYDVMDQLVEMKDALGGTWKIAYDPAGNPITFIDANDQSTHLEYNGNRQLIASQDALGQRTRFELNAVGNIEKVIDALGRATLYTYDPNDNLASVQDALGNSTLFEYDAEDQLTTITDALQHQTRFVYDEDGLVTKMTEAGGQVSSFAFDKAHNMVRFTNAKGNRWEYTYDEMNQRISEKDPLGNTTAYQYDLLGRQSHIIDAKQVVTRYDYDALNRLIAVVQNESAQASDHQTNVKTSYGYDEVGNLANITDPRGYVTTFTYDLLDRVIQERNALTNTWEYQYDPIGNLVSRLDANKAKTEYTYDAISQLTRVDYPDRSFIKYEYDEVGNQTSANASWLGAITNTYDNLNRLVTSSDHTGKTLRYLYDAVSNQTGLVYPDGKTVSYAYDETNYLTRFSNPEGNVFGITRDATHNATQIYYPNRTVARYVFDTAERLTSVTNMRQNGTLINKFVYTLDEIGNRTQTDTTYTMGQGKVVRNSSKYEYDPLYRLVGSSDSLGFYSKYSYDAASNRTRLVTNFDPTRGKQRDTLTYTYTYDEINALKNISLGSTWRDLGGVSTHLKAFVNEAQAQSGKGIETDTANELIKAATNIIGLIDGGITDLSKVDGAVAQLGEQVQTALTQGKLTSGAANSLQAKLKEAKESNKNGKPKDVSEISLDYDKNGNRIEHLMPDPQGSNGWLRTSYAYDFENRLVNAQDFRVNNVNSNGKGQPGQESRMTFDAYGRLFERRHDQHLGGGGVVHATQFVYDGLDPIVEYYDPSAVQYTNYYRGEGRILSMLTNAGADYAPGRAEYFHYDGLNSVTALSKHSGQRAQDYRYSDFGTILDNNGRAQNASNFTDPHNHYAYTGQEWDENTGLFHFYAREYDPFTGTWLQQDPYRGLLDMPMSLHRYGYVGNNPVLNIDNYGYCELICVAIVGGIMATIFITSIKPAYAPAPDDQLGNINDLIKKRAEWLNQNDSLNTITGYKDLMKDSDILADPNTSGGDKLSAGANALYHTAKNSALIYGAAYASRYLFTKVVQILSPASTAACADGDCTNEMSNGLKVTQHLLKRMSERGITAEQINKTIEIGQKFNYYHGEPGTEVWKVGYYNPQTGLFVGTVGDKITTAFITSQNYINNLINNSPK